MAKPTITLLVASVLTLSGCGKMTPEQEARLDAMMGCLAKADSQFPILKDIPDSASDEASDNFGVEENGDFEFRGTGKGGDRPLPDTFACRGNSKTRILTSVELNGVVKRPAENEVWKY